MEDMKISNMNIASLDLLSEENPSIIIDKFEAICANPPEGISINVLSYFKAKALVSLNRLNESEQLITDLLGKAVLCKDYFSLVKCYILLSKCYSDPKTRHRVKPSLELALEYAHASKNEGLLAEALSNLGYYFFSQKDYKTALEYQLRATGHLKKQPVSTLNVQILIRTAAVYNALQKVNHVVSVLIQALEVCQASDDKTHQFIIVNNLVTAYIKLKKYAEAEDVLAQAIKFCREKHINIHLLRMTYNQGILRTHQARFEEAIDIYQKCLEIHDSLKLHNLPLLLDIYNNISVCYGMLEKADQTIEYLNKAEEIAIRLNDSDLTTQVCVNKANYFVQTGNYEEALILVHNAIDYYTKKKSYENQITAMRIQSLIYEKKKELAKSIKVCRDIDKVYMSYINQIQMDKTESCNIQMSELSSNINRARENVQFIIKNHKRGLNQEFIGKSAAYMSVVNSALLAAQHPNASVFIIGESGTGKEIIANLIHNNSIRRDYPFVPVNASAISTGLLESELFGHKRGAFTGATTDTKGFFVQSNKGTLFLDEITEMPVEHQVKLLRALETRKITPVGSVTEVDFDSRVISSTNRNIYEQLQRNEFRLDLFHRLNTIEITIPPLRQRTEDIELLLNHFVNLYTNETKRPQPRIELSFLNRLKHYSFPGNVRELKNIVERLFIMADNQVWNENILGFLNPAFQGHEPQSSTLSMRVKNEEELIIQALITAKGRQIDAAKLLEISESTLTRRIAKYHLDSYTRKGN